MNPPYLQRLAVALFLLSLALVEYVDGQFCGLAASGDGAQFYDAIGSIEHVSNGRAAFETAAPPPFPFFGETVTSVYVHTNGQLQVNRAIGFDYHLERGSEKMAVYSADHSADGDAGGSGEMRWHALNSYEMCQVHNDLRANGFVDAEDFEPVWGVSAIWCEIGCWDGHCGNKQTSFQVALITDTVTTYAVYIYGPLEWDGFLSNDDGLWAGVGFSMGEGKFYETEHSHNATDPRNHGTDSNVGVDGLWMFQIDGDAIVDAANFDPLPDVACPIPPTEPPTPLTCREMECLPGFTGDNCTDDMDECSAEIDMCLNGGTCENTEGAFECACPDGWMGTICDTPSDCTDTAPTATTGGEIVGCLLESGVKAYRGVPYSAPRTDANRYRHPIPPEPWTSPLETKVFSAGCLQLPLFGTFAYYARLNSEDCLYLNIWVPADASGAPVLVWIFGGEFQVQNGAAAGDAPAEMAADFGVVVVTFNHRVGPFGFTPYDESEMNAGLYDVVAVVQWVAENIASFGGDPTAVTLGGDGSGAIAVGLLTISPLSNTLFHQSIKISGGWADPRACRDSQISTLALQQSILDDYGETCVLSPLDLTEQANRLPRFGLNQPFGPDCLNDATMFPDGLAPPTSPKPSISAYNLHDAAFFTALEGVLDIGEHSYLVQAFWSLESVVDDYLTEGVQLTLASLGLQVDEAKLATIMELVELFYTDPTSRHDDSRLSAEEKVAHVYTRVMQDLYYAGGAAYELYDATNGASVLAANQYVLVNMHAPSDQETNAIFQAAGGTFTNLVGLLFNRPIVFSLGTSAADENTQAIFAKYIKTFLLTGEPWSMATKKLKPKTKKWPATKATSRIGLKLVKGKTQKAKKFAKGAITMVNLLTKAAAGELNVKAEKKKLNKVLKSLAKFPI